jgi:hypothetical protein
MEPELPEEAASGVDESSMQAQLLPSPTSRASNDSTSVREAGHSALFTIEQAIEAYVQEMRATGRAPKTLQRHQISLSALRRYLWRQFHLTDVRSLTRACMQSWVTDLHIMLSTRIKATRSVNTVVAYARSARAFWFVTERTT